MIEIPAFFIIGLTGGFGHCVLMCHPFVLYVSGRYSASRAGYSMLIPHIYYNLGRILTYSALGAAAGFLGSVVQYAGAFTGVQKLAAILGGILLTVFAALSLSGISGAFFPAKLNISKYISRFEPPNPLFLGLMLGLLPCGLSMGAVIGAASSGSAFTGALLLFAFGIGTSAAMMTMALFGNLALKYSVILKKAGGILLFIMGAYFIYMGVSF